MMQRRGNISKTQLRTTSEKNSFVVYVYIHFLTGQTYVGMACRFSSPCLNFMCRRQEHVKSGRSWATDTTMGIRSLFVTNPGIISEHIMFVADRAVDRYGASRRAVNTIEMHIAKALADAGMLANLRGIEQVALANPRTDGMSDTEWASYLAAIRDIKSRYGTVAVLTKRLDSGLYKKTREVVESGWAIIGYRQRHRDIEAFGVVFRLSKEALGTRIKTAHALVKIVHIMEERAVGARLCKSFLYAGRCRRCTDEATMWTLSLASLIAHNRSSGKLSMSHALRGVAT